MRPRTYWSFLILTALASVGTITISELAWGQLKLNIASRPDFDLIQTAVAAVVGVGASIWAVLGPRFRGSAKLLITLLAGGGGMMTCASFFVVDRRPIPSSRFDTWAVITLIAMTMWLAGILAFMYLLWRPCVRSENHI
jgi:hypothetical protein